MRTKALHRVAASAMVLWFLAGVYVWLSDDEKMRILAGGFLRDLLVVGLIIWAAWEAGDRLRKALGDASRGLDGFLVATALGLGADVILLFALGILGLLYTSAIVAMIALPLFLSLGRVKGFMGSGRKGKVWVNDGEGLELSWIEWASVGSMFIVSGSVLLSALAPEIFYDALYYHDAFPALYLIRHRLEIYPYAAHSAMPSNIDLLYTMPLAFAGAQSVRLLHIMFYAGTGMWVYSMGRGFFGRDAGVSGCVLWITIPGVAWMAGLGAVDMGVVFFALGAMSLLLRWAFAGEGRGTPVISAILLGVAVGSKYTAMMVGVLCAAGVVAGALRRRSEIGKKGALAAVALYGAVAIAVASPWYIRSWVVMGDPFYPALSKKGAPGAFARDNLKKDAMLPYPIFQTLSKLPDDLWKSKKPFGAGALLGIGIFAVVPALFWGLWRRRGPEAWLAIGALAMYLMWSRSILIVRYLYPGLALGAALAGAMLAPGGSHRLRGALVALFVIMITLYDVRAVGAFYEGPMGDVLRYISSARSPEEYLEKREHTYAAAAFIRQIPADKVKMLFVGETQGFYFARDYMPVSGYDRHPLEDWIMEAGNPEALRALIKGKGFFQIVVNRSEWKRLNLSYGYLTLDERGEKIFDDMLGRLPSIYRDRNIEIYAL